MRIRCYEFGQAVFLRFAGTQREPGLFREPSINSARNTRRHRSVDGLGAGKHYDHHYRPRPFVEGAEPAHVARHAEIGAGARLSQNTLVGIVVRAPGGAFFFLITQPQPKSTLFPYTTLFR